MTTAKESIQFMLVETRAPPVEPLLLDGVEAEPEAVAGTRAAPVYWTPFAVAATWNTEPPPYS